MAERQFRRRGAVVAAAGVVMLAGGCGEAVPDGGGEEGAAVVRGAAAELVRARSSKARTSMEMAAGGTRVTIRGRGVYDFREQVGQLKVSLPQGPAGDPTRQPITELLAPGALFMKNRGAGVPEDKWVRVETGSMADGNLVTGGATDPLAAAEILRGARDVRYMGAERVGGVDVRHYRGVADLWRAARRASEGPRDALAAAAKGFATPRVPFDVYLDEQGRIRKIRHRFSFVNGQQERPVDVASTTLLYEFGVDVDVRLPDRDDIFAGRIAEE